RVLVPKCGSDAWPVESCRASDALKRRARQACRPELTLHIPERFVLVELSWPPASPRSFCTVLHRTPTFAIVCDIVQNTGRFGEPNSTHQEDEGASRNLFAARSSWRQAPRQRPCAKGSRLGLPRVARRCSNACGQNLRVRLTCWQGTGPALRRGTLL